MKKFNHFNALFISSLCIIGFLFSTTQARADQSDRSETEKVSSNLNTEVNTVADQSKKIDGIKNKNIESNLVFSSSGLLVPFNDKFKAYFSVWGPDFQDMSGEQNSSNYRALFGINMRL
jgi:hypothetical protein